MKANNLIFLISQPRSGSTLTQKILGAHKQIYTRSEPWIMLPIATIMKNQNISMVYDAPLERQAFHNFIGGFDEGEEFYLEKLREMHLSLYEFFLIKNNKQFFLDKTPRYYLIIEQLTKIFPTAKQVILVRNPLSVLNSLIERRSSWQELTVNKQDLITAIEEILKTIHHPSKNQYILRYEEILRDSKSTISKLCDFLNIQFDEKMLSDYANKTNHFEFGDQKIYKQKTIDSTKSENWKIKLDDPQYWRLMYDYLLYIGEKKYAALGYNYEESLTTLMQNCPFTSLDKTKDKTISLMTLLQ